MSCEKYQSLPLDERTPEDRLAIELAEVPHIHMLLVNEAESKNSSPNNGAGALGATRSSSERGGATI